MKDNWERLHAQLDLDTTAVAALVAPLGSGTTVRAATPLAGGAWLSDPDFAPAIGQVLFNGRWWLWPAVLAPALATLAATAGTDGTDEAPICAADLLPPPCTVALAIRVAGRDRR